MDYAPQSSLDRDTLLSLLQHVHDGIYFVDTNRVIRFWSDGAERLSGYTASEVTGRRCGDFLMHVDDQGEVLCGERCPLRDCAERRCRIAGRVWLKHAAGHRVPVHVTATPLFDPSGRCSGMVEIFRDATEEIALLQRANELESQALLDPLTRIGNRRYAEQVLRQSWDAWTRYQSHFGIAIFDVDHFKRVNDESGHPAGDAVLRAIAQTLSSSLRSFDFVGRWGGEEFLAIIQCVGPEDLATVARRCQELARATSISWQGRTIGVTLSAGAAAIEGCPSIDAMLQLADTRLYCAKNAGRNQLIGPLSPRGRQSEAA